MGKTCRMGKPIPAQMTRGKVILPVQKRKQRPVRSAQRSSKGDPTYHCFDQGRNSGAERAPHSGSRTTRTTTSYGNLHAASLQHRRWGKLKTFPGKSFAETRFMQSRAHEPPHDPCPPRPTWDGRVLSSPSPLPRLLRWKPVPPSAPTLLL